MSNPRLWPIVGIAGLLLSMLVLACGVLQSVVSLISPDPITAFDGTVLPDSARFPIALGGVLCYAVPAVLIGGTCLTLWLTYGRNPPLPNPGARSCAMLLIILAVAVMLLGGVMVISLNLIGAGLGTEIIGRPAGSGEAIAGIALCSGIAAALVITGLAVWFLRVHRRA